MSPIQVDGYCKAVIKMLKTENGSNSESENSIESPVETSEKGSRGTKYDDEQAKILLAKREEYLRKKNGKNYKMPLIEAFKTGAFALK